jgi:NTE family protein
MENIVEENIEKPLPNIKHIVISGGGPAGFLFYGAIRELHIKKFWNLENIETLHGISIGSILIVFLCFNYDWEVFDDFIIKRPWHNLFKINLLSITNSFQKKGIFSKEIIKEGFQPLFKDKDLSIDITLKEFYEFSKKDLHIYATELHKYDLIDFSHKTHPDWKLIDVIYCSCSIPGIFIPYIVDECCYCDGGIISNYPLRQCLDYGAEPESILGIKMMVDPSKNSLITEESSIFDYLIGILNKLLFKRLSPLDINVTKIPYEITLSYPQLSLYNSYDVMSSQEKRIELIEFGKKRAIENFFT